MIALDQTQLKTVQRILRAYVPNWRVVAFGSRVQGRARPFSDLDLVLIGDDPIDPEVMSELRLHFAESDLTIRVDLLEWQRLSPSFRRVISNSPVESIQEPAETEPAPQEKTYAIRPI